MPENNANFYRQQINTGLARNDSISQMFMLNQNGKRIVIIKMRSLAGNEESDLLKAVHALSGDPALPDDMDEVSLQFERTVGTQQVQPFF